MFQMVMQCAVMKFNDIQVPHWAHLWQQHEGLHLQGACASPNSKTLEVSLGESQEALSTKKVPKTTPPPR